MVMFVRDNFIIKVLVSYPVILIVLYFIPFIGVCLLLFRMFIYNRKRVRDLLFIIGVGVLILIPKIVNYILGVISYDIDNISYLSDIVNSDLYNVDFIGYSKFLIGLGIILLIVSYVVNIIFRKFNNSLVSYIKNIENRDREIASQNDMKMRIKRERAVNTSYVKCPYCGSDNLVSDKFGVCKYCRRKIENRSYR